MSEEESTTTPNPCGSADVRPFPVQPVVPAVQDRRQERRRQAGPRIRNGRISSIQDTGFGQLNRKRRFQKRYRVATGPSKQRHAKRFCQEIKKPRTSVSRIGQRRQNQGQANRHYIVRRRAQVISEVARNRQITSSLESQLTSLQTLRRELDNRMAAVLDALTAAAEDPTNALPRISAAAGAQVEIMKKLIDLLQTIDFSGLYD